MASGACSGTVPFQCASKDSYKVGSAQRLQSMRTRSVYEKDQKGNCQKCDATAEYPARHQFHQNTDVPEANINTLILDCMIFQIADLVAK